MCADWIRQQTREFVDGITHVFLDPFRGYANAIRSELPSDTVTVLDAFRVVKLASTAMDGGSEAINLIAEKSRRVAHGFRNFTKCRIRILLAADGSQPWGRQRRESE